VVKTLSEESRQVNERREHKRIPLRYNIRYGTTDPPQHVSFITDLSSTGIYIHTNRIFAPGTRLFLEVDTDKDTLKAQGLVAWSRKAPPHLIRHVKSGMGIRFTSLDQGFLDLIEERAVEHEGAQ